MYIYIDIYACITYHIHSHQLHFQLSQHRALLPTARHHGSPEKARRQQVPGEEIQKSLMVAILILRNPKPQNFKMWQGSQVALIWMEYRQPEQFKTVSRSHASDQWLISIIVQVSLCCNKIVRKGCQFTGCLDCLESWPNKDITIINPHKAIQDNSQVQWCVICLAWDSWPCRRMADSKTIPANACWKSWGFVCIGPPQWHFWQILLHSLQSL